MFYIFTSDFQMQHFVVPNFGESDETDIMLSRTPELWLDTDNTLMSDQLLLDHDMQNKNMDAENSPPTNRMNRAHKRNKATMFLKRKNSAKEI